MKHPKCKLCKRILPRGVHHNTKYHEECTNEMQKAHKRKCWHRNKEEYRA